MRRTGWAWCWLVCWHRPGCSHCSHCSHACVSRPQILGQNIAQFCQNTLRVRELAKSPDHPHQLGDGAVLQPLSPEPGLPAEVGPRPGHLPRLPRLLLRVLPRPELQRGVRLRQKQRPTVSGEQRVVRIRLITKATQITHI